MRVMMIGTHQGRESSGAPFFIEDPNLALIPNSEPANLKNALREKSRRISILHKNLKVLDYRFGI